MRAIKNSRAPAAMNKERRLSPKGARKGAGARCERHGNPCSGVFDEIYGIERMLRGGK